MLISLKVFKQGLLKATSVAVVFFFITYAGNTLAQTTTGIVLSDELASQRLMFSSSKPQTRYDIALGNFRRINSEWRVEKEIQVNGSLERNTFEFQSGVNFTEAWRMLNDHFVTKDSEELYKCSGLDCGSSNVWANDYFGIKQLYGLDQSQRYKVVKTTNVDTTVHHILYLVKRGNRRIHAQVDVLSFSGSPSVANFNADNIVTALEENLYWIFPADLSVDREGTWQETVNVLQEIVVAIQQYSKRYPSANLYLVGHDSSGDSFEEQIKNSLSQAERISKKLLPLVKEQTWKLHGVGGLSPRTDKNALRVELVAQPE